MPKLKLNSFVDVAMIPLLPLNLIYIFRGLQLRAVFAMLNKAVLVMFVLLKKSHLFSHPNLYATEPEANVTMVMILSLNVNGFKLSGQNVNSK